jgi:hypothetical protein
MGHATEERSKFGAVAVITMGLLAIMLGLSLMSQGLEQNSEFHRWQAAPLIQKTGKLQAIGSGSDVVMVGSIDPKNPTSKGQVIYTYWEQRRDSLNGEDYWTHVSAKDHKPAFQLLLGNQMVTIQSSHASLRKAQKALISFNVKLYGFTCGEKVTVFGTVVSSNAPSKVQASIICGGGNEECLKVFSTSSTSDLQMAAFLMLVGGVLILAGARQLKMSLNEPAASE